MKKLITTILIIGLICSLPSSYYGETLDVYGKQQIEIINILSSTNDEDIIPVSVSFSDIDYEEAESVAMEQLKNEISPEIINIAFYGGDKTTLSPQEAEKEFNKIIETENNVIAEMTEENNNAIIEELFPDEKPEIIESGIYTPMVSMNLKKKQIADLMYNPNVTKISTLEPIGTSAPISSDYFQKVSYLAQTPSNLKSGNTWTIKLKNGTAEKWTSSNTKIAKVVNGKITALNKGSCQVSVKLKSGATLKCNVKVTTTPVVSKSSVTVKKGKTTKIKLYGKASGINNTYTNTKYAKINSKRTSTVIIIKGLKVGTTTIKIKVNGVKTIPVKVKVRR